MIAGELLRLLVHHPEVELKFAFSRSHRGRSLSSQHKGLVGDTDLHFSETMNLDEVDVLFITSSEYSADSQMNLPEDLKVVLIQESDEFKVLPPFDALEFVPGVSEMFRKPLVRGAKASRVLTSPATLALILLYPLALHLLLNDSIALKIKLPEFRKSILSRQHLVAEIENRLQDVQLSFHHLNSVDIETSETIRALSVEAEFPCMVSEEEIEKIYEGIYDDHNFTFLIRNDIDPAEVAGTHKCLINISKPDEDTLRVKAVADAVLRGGAGDAVHAMNLLCGLFEKTGLSLPAGLAFKEHEI